EALALARDVAEQAGEREPVHVLHGHEQLALALAEVDDLDDVRMLQGRADPSLVDEHRDEARVLRELGQNALDREALREAVRPRPASHENFRHASETEALSEYVRAEPHG